MALITFTVKLTNESVLSRFVEQVLDNKSVKSYISTKSDLDKEKYTKMLNNMKLYENAQDKEEVYFRLCDVSILMDVDKGSAIKRAKVYDEKEVTKANIFGFLSKIDGFIFLTQAGLIRFIYSCRSAMAKVFRALFTDIILELSKDPRVIVSAIKNTLANKPEELYEFVEDFNDRSIMIRFEYEMEREKNKHLMQMNDIYRSQVEKTGKILGDLSRENMCLTEQCDHLMHERKLTEDEAYVNFLKANFLKHLYVYLIDPDETLRQFKNIIIPENYHRDIEECYKYKYVLGGSYMGYKITDKKMEGREPIKMEYVNGNDILTRIKEDLVGSISLKVSSSKTGPIYIYGCYEIVQHIFDQYKRVISRKPGS